ncbi:MAG: T9SS type A sorting domain-containing protein, partial [Fidelibacterota bacterium]
GHNHIRSVAALRFAKEYVQKLFDTQFDFETTATVADVIDAVRPENLDVHVRVLSGDTTAVIGGTSQRIVERFYTNNMTEANDMPLAKQYLTETLESFGYTVLARPVEAYGSVDIHDLLVYKEGTEYPDSCILMTAFYDGIECWSKPSVINPNADLNASGVAALLECARILKDVDTPYSILFALWGSWEIGAESFKEWPDNPWWDQILFNVDVEAIGYDTLNLREIVPQYSDREGNIAIQSYVMDRMQSVLYQNAINLSIGRRWQGTTYGQADPLPSISFTQSIYHPDTSYEYLISNPNMHGFGRDDMEFFDLPVFHDRARAVIGLVADLALYGIPENLPAEIQSVIKPESFVLYPNYPNPFNPVTHIEFSLPEPAQITLNIYDITGRLVEQLVNQHTPAGYHTVTWDAFSYSSGVYIARLKAGSSVKTQKMMLMK